MQEFQEVGLLLNGDKTVVLPNEAQPPSHLWTQTGIKLQVKNGSGGGHKWLGCILRVGKAGRTTLDVNHHLQAASKAFFANKTIFCDRTVRGQDRQRFLDAVVSPVAVFRSGHRTIHQKDLHHLDGACRKFLLWGVPPSNLDWSHGCTSPLFFIPLVSIASWTFRVFLFEFVGSFNIPFCSVDNRSPPPLQMKYRGGGVP